MDPLVHHLDPTDWQINQVRPIPRVPPCVPPTLLGPARLGLSHPAHAAGLHATAIEPRATSRSRAKWLIRSRAVENCWAEEKWLTGSQAVKMAELWKMAEHFSKMAEHNRKNSWVHCNNEKMAEQYNKMDEHYRKNDWVHCINRNGWALQ
jgi:hypothetical protein